MILTQFESRLHSSADITVTCCSDDRWKEPTQERDQHGVDVPPSIKTLA